MTEPLFRLLGGSQSSVSSPLTPAFSVTSSSISSSPSCQWKLQLISQIDDYSAANSVTVMMGSYQPNQCILKSCGGAPQEQWPQGQS